MHQASNKNQTANKNRPIWQRIPLYVQIVIALIIGACLGLLLGAGNPSPSNAALSTNLAVPCNLVLKALRALATPLIFLAVLQAFLSTNIPSKAGRRLITLLFTAINVMGDMTVSCLLDGKQRQTDTESELLSVST